jgi:hypothetical protein
VFLIALSDSDPLTVVSARIPGRESFLISLIIVSLPSSDSLCGDCGGLTRLTLVEHFLPRPGLRCSASFAEAVDMATQNQRITDLEGARVELLERVDRLQAELDQHRPVGREVPAHTTVVRPSQIWTIGLNLLVMSVRTVH